MYCRYNGSIKPWNSHYTIHNNKWDAYIPENLDPHLWRCSKDRGTTLFQATGNLPLKYQTITIPELSYSDVLEISSQQIDLTSFHYHTLWCADYSLQNLYVKYLNLKLSRVDYSLIPLSKY
jgi:hypothetical protein